MAKTTCRIFLVSALSLGLLFLPGLMGQDRALADHPDKWEYMQSDFEEVTSKELPMWWDKYTKGKYLTGNWGGLRTSLEKIGINILVNYSMDAMGNINGGDRRGFCQSSSFFAGTLLDFGKMAGIKGLQFKASMIYRFGTSATNEYIGNQFNVQQNFGGQWLHLYDLWFKYILWDGERQRLKVKIGRFAQGDDFLSDPLYWNYVNNAFDGNPVSIFLNSPMEAYPNATWAAYAYTNPIDLWYFQAGVYGADPRLNQEKYHGAWFGFDYSQGAYIMAQTGIKFNDGKNDKGLKGKYSIGGYYVTGEFTNWTTGQQQRGNAGGYIMIDQMLYRSQSDPTQGLTAWVAAVFGQEDIGQMPYFVNGGLVYRGLIPDRPKDKTILGFVWGKFSDKMSNSIVASGGLAKDYEALVEVSYRFHFSDFFTIQPDFQYIFNPGGTGSLGDAVCFGFQFLTTI